MLVLCCTFKFSPIPKAILGFLNAALVGRLNFSQFKEKKAVLPNVTNSLKSWEIGIFEVSLILYLSDCEDSLSGTVCL